MPSIVGNIKVISVGNSSILQIGEAVQLSPSTSSKTFAGAGSCNAGDFAHMNNGISNSITNDQDEGDLGQTNVWNQGGV